MATRVEEVTVKLREMIVTRELPPGSRVPERDLAAILGVSRTPVRVALGILEAEGLVTGAAHCGFVVAPFSIDDVLSAYDVRGVLEGLAVRILIERGIAPDTLRLLDDCVAEGDALVATGRMDEGDMRRWSATNAQFHGTILEGAELSALTKTHGFVSRMPLAAPVAILFTNHNRELARRKMIDAHQEHRHILDAIRNGQASRAGHLMEEHAHRSRDNLRNVLLGRATSGTGDFLFKTGLEAMAIADR